VDVELAADLRPIEVDGAQIGRVLVNLIDNALKFSPDAPVELVGAQENGNAVVRVVDHGPGLSDGELLRVFEPFEQGRVPSRGSGLGLAIAKGFAQANGARLEAESSRNGGASFVLSLPSKT
jgi:two-component system sensor histidine kinase KdpD